MTRPPRRTSDKTSARFAGGTSADAGARGGGRGFRPQPRFATRDEAAPPAREPVARRDGARPAERVPVIECLAPSADHALLDSGDGLKLERIGPVTIVRPEAQALWRPALGPSRWAAADAVFTGDTEEEGSGRWRFSTPFAEDRFEAAFDGMPYYGRFTAFRHIGIFAEQAPLWAEMERLVTSARRTVSVLNLFGYTGIATLLAARAGAEVTHIDASKKAIGWARDNQALAGLQAKPVRWICEDAGRFVEREIKRGKTYDIILADPPAYGRGPSGEVWQLFDDLPRFLDNLRQIMAPDALALMLTTYAIRASFFGIHHLMRETLAGLGGTVTSGELTVAEESAGRVVSASLYSRWSRT